MARFVYLKNERVLAKRNLSKVSITFYATLEVQGIRPYMPAMPYLLPASSWARRNLCKPNLPPHIIETAADCGGFVATRIWGDYRYSPERYVRWLMTFKPQWAAMFDYCCEDEITSNQPGVVRLRQERTLDMMQKFWRDFAGAPWTWVPTVQGWTVQDYVWMAKEMAFFLPAMAQQPDFRIGIGTLCRRASPAMIQQVVTAVSEVLPGVGLHLWGVKLSAIQNWQNVVSVDSGAWNGHFGRDKHRIRADRQQRGMTKAQYDYLVSLPAYVEKINARLAAD